MNNIVYDSWRQDVFRIDGSLIKSNVLFVRATKGDIQYFIPIFEEDKDNIQDAKDLLALKVKHEA